MYYYIIILILTALALYGIQMLCEYLDKNGY